MLIRRAEIYGHGMADLRISNGTIKEIGELVPKLDEPLIEARGGALLPGLHDHHIHLAGLAVRSASIVCGPPEVTNADELEQQLRRPGEGWIRGILYHESVMSLPDAQELDRLVPDRPMRIQHRSGRMWLLNSAALENLLARASPPPGLERGAAGFTGRLFDEDQWLREALDSQPPDFTKVSADLARFGVTGITDMSPGNDPAMASHFAQQMQTDAIAQRCVLAGALSLAGASPGPWQLGPAKLHLHEAALPPYEEAVQFIVEAHGQKRSVAVHCVTETELVFALAALEDAGTRSGDRIEHASIAPPALIERMASMGLSICTQPHFVVERGDRYLADVEERYQPDLYRLRSLSDAGIPLAGGSDAPFGSADPWQAMRAAVARTTESGRTIGIEETLRPEDALALYLAAPDDLSCTRRIALGEPADLCLLDRPWKDARLRLDARDVRMTFVSGRVIHDSVDQAPG